VLVASLALRVGLAEYAIRSVQERMPDTEIYTGYADAIYHGRPYKVGDSRALRAPGYPAFMAACWTLYGERSPRAVLYAQAVLGAATALFVYRLGRSFEETGGAPGMALAACAIAAFEPYGLVLGALELSETLFTTLLVACAWMVRRWTLRPSAAASAAAGVLAGSAVLVRPSALLLAPLAAAVATVFSSDRRSTVRGVAVAAACGVLVLAPWWIRNAAVLGRPVWTTTNVGESLFDAWNPRATGASDMGFASDPDVLAMPEIDRDAHWRARAIAFAKAEPARVFWLGAVKLARFWSPWPNEPRYRTPWVVAAAAAPTVLIYALSIAGLYAALRDEGNTRPLAGFVLVPAAYFCLLHAVFVGSVRYRAPLAPLLALAAGLGVAALVSRVATGRSATPEA
jgi:hypothetical protein